MFRFSGIISVLEPGKELVVFKTRMLFGFGVMDVIVAVGKTTVSKRGFLLGFFFIPFPS